ncbi:hypothetical protein K2173_000905 [Erythroxylum novogranatense]|uniref:Uncharacterized protein n=1 Tax=Erythroxylum novogranatense TaxID=1862640 RepID=A0AAV8TSA8_9ROSI|nr:hypothetical protein K2173_000905 [Erythroxylum novogranatense]
MNPSISRNRRAPQCHNCVICGYAYHISTVMHSLKQIRINILSAETYVVLMMADSFSSLVMAVVTPWRQSFGKLRLCALKFRSLRTNLT